MTVRSQHFVVLLILTILAILLIPAGQGNASGDGKPANRLNAGPVIDVWYGSEQTF